MAEAEVMERLDVLQRRFDPVLYLPEARVQSDDIQLIYNTHTLAELCYLRRRLVTSDKPVDRFLVGAVLGIMHGSERNDKTSGYASIAMPNTFSMSPNYVRRFVERRLSRPYRNVFDVVRGKVVRLFANGTIAEPEGVVAWCNVKRISENAGFAPYRGRVKLIVTSPPYLDVVNYAKQNWIRNWFMATHSQYSLFESLDDALTLDRWTKFMDAATVEMQKMLAPDGVIVLVVGDVSRGSGAFISLAREYLHQAFHKRVFSYIGCFEDELREGVKTTRIWGDTKGKATDTDRIVVLSNRTPTFRSDRLMHVFGDSSKVLPEDLNLMDADLLAEHARAFASSTGDAVAV
jgi:site-specific DNA-methyltransferase (adenine-specific)